ncbi:hypothetical protein Patl1_25313 [Pistacia atlantica]|uniref:Uncharacterized protein n=1 Tax=Pistacia atlantica TaxID=434234 RepID=A0ACC1B2Q7_9ROSI|nr:hypothetical protein Patl1_25313 [Pistacia atlantica]
MAKFSASFYLLVAMLVFASVKSMLPKVEGACEKATIGGGCPDVSKCVELCRPCYRGVGIIAVFCRAAGGGIPYDQCICSFKRGAPCDPPAPPRCPALWSPPVENTLNGTLIA